MDRSNKKILKYYILPANKICSGWHLCMLQFTLHTIYLSYTVHLTKGIVMHYETLTVHMIDISSGDRYLCPLQTHCLICTAPMHFTVVFENSTAMYFVYSLHNNSRVLAPRHWLAKLICHYEGGERSTDTYEGRPHEPHSISKKTTSKVNLTSLSDSTNTWSYSLKATRNMMDVTFSKQWIHFLRSDLWPPTSTILKQRLKDLQLKKCQV